MASTDLELSRLRGSQAGPPPQPVGGAPAPLPPAADQPLDDWQLVRRLVAGDRAAWTLFVQQFQRLVLARVMVTARELSSPLDAAGAEDLCAEVFARLVADDYRVLRSFEGRSSLSTWLSVVARRIAMRRLSTAAREPSRAVADASAALGSLASNAADEPLRLLLAGEQRERLTSAIAQLSDRHRQLVCLLFYDGCTYREVSDRLQMPMNSIGPTLARIQNRLRTALQESEP